MRHHLSTLATATLLAVSVASWAQQSQAPRRSGASPGGMPHAQTEYRGPVVWVNTNVVVGTITNIQPQQRMLTARTEDGRLITMAASADVHNFDRLKRGDLVTIRYTEAEAVTLVKHTGQDGPGIRSTVEASSGTQAPQGAARPAIGATERTTLVANVFDIDRQRGIISLRGTGGEAIDIRANPKALEQINKNDQVRMTYVQSTAVEIRPGNTRPTGPLPGQQAGSGSGSTAR